MDPIVKTPGIQSGGFAGGISTGAPGVPQGSELFDLAEALGSFSKTLDRGMQTWHGAQEDSKRLAIDVQKKDAEVAAQEIIANELKGYTAKQMGDALLSTPLAEKFAANPYILPAVQIHRGRRMADEAAQSMAEGGVDVKNPAAVNEWLKGNVDRIDDKFTSSGFNEQWERVNSRFASMALEDTFKKVERDRQQMGATEWDATFDDSRAAGLGLEDSVLNAFEALRSVPGIDGPEATEIQMQALAKASQSGDKELAATIANMKRGDAPSLLGDGKVSVQAQKLVLNAETEWMQKRETTHIQFRTAANDAIDKGITRGALENLPEMQTLKTEDADKHAQVIERWRSENDRKLAEARRNAAVASKQVVSQDLITAAAQSILDGEGEFIRDVTKSVGEGLIVDMSRTELRDQGLLALRQAKFPEGFANVPPEKLAAINIYTRRLSDSGMVDPELAGFLQGSTAYTTPEGLQGNEKDLVQAYKLYKNIDPVIAQNYFRDVKQVAVFETMDKLIRGNPDMDPKQAATRAVTTTFYRAPKADARKDVREAAEAVRILDPLNPNGGFFGIGAGENRIAVPVDQIQEELEARVLDLSSFGVPRAEALTKARDEVQGGYVAVYGKAVKLPHDPATPRMSQEKWAKTVTSALEHTASTGGGEPKDYLLKHIEGSNYLLTYPNGRQAFVTTKNLLQLADARAVAAAKDAEYARIKAAQDAAKARGGK